MPRANDWQRRFGASRRARDRALLAEAERAIGLEDCERPPAAKIDRGPSAASSEAREAIARAFGRPVQ
jgi:hypothetical protein